MTVQLGYRERETLQTVVYFGRLYTREAAYQPPLITRFIEAYSQRTAGCLLFGIVLRDSVFSQREGGRTRVNRPLVGLLLVLRLPRHYGQPNH